MSGNDLSLELKLKADASQYTAELTRAGQTLSTFTAQVQGGGAAASGALQSMATAAQRIGDSAGGAARKLGDDLGAMAGQLARGGDATQLLAGRSEGLVRTLLGSSPALGAAAAGVMVLAAAYQRGSAEAAGYRQALIMTGNAAETSVGQMADMARAIGQVVGTQGAAAAAVTQLAASGKVGGEAMQGLAQSAIQAQRSLGVAVDDTVRQYAQLADKPVEASVKLNESVRHLTAGTYDQIRAAQEQGRAQDAARLAQQAYADTLSQRAAEMEKSLGTLQRAWRATGEAAKGAWDWMLNLGRERTAQQQLDSATRNVEALQQQLADQQSRGRATGQLPEQLAAAQRRLLDLQNEAALTGIAASAQAEQNQATQAYIALGQLRQQHLSAEEKMQRAVADATRAYEGALKDTTLTAAQRTQAERDYLAIVSDITRGKETAAPKARQAADTELASLQAQLQAARQYHEQLLTLGAGASQLNAAERESLKLAELIRQATDAKTIARLQEKQAIADALGVQLRSNAGLEASFKSHQALIDATAQDADALNQRAAAQEAANQVFGKGRTAIEEMTLAELQKQMAEAQASDSFDPKYIASLELKIAAQERWVGALQGADYKAATKHVDELLRGAQELARAYEDEQALSGLTALEREKIVAQRQVELKYAKALAAIDKAALTDAEKQALRDEAQEARRIESAAAVAKAEQQHMARAADEINRSLTDALMRGFENGKGFAQNLADTTVNLFKTMVLRPTISAIMTPVSLVINGVVQQGLNAVGLGSGGSGLMGLANNASSLYSGASSFNTGWFTNFGATAPASLYSSGAQLYSQGFETIGNGMMDLGNNLAQYSEDINTAATWISYGKAVYDLTQGKYGSAVGTAVGSYFFGPIGAAIGSFLGGLVDKWTGSRGANHSGGAYGTSGKDRNAALSGLGLTGDALGDFTERGNQAIDEQLGKAVESMGGLYNSLAKYAGGSAKQLDIVAGFAVNGAHKDEDAYGYFKLLDKLTGETLASYSKRDGGLGSDPEKAWAQYIADMGGALVGELRKADIPKWMDDIFAGMGDKITLDGLNGAMQQIAKIDGAFTQLGWHIGYLADISGDTQTALLELSGGVDGLMKNTGAYYQNFYSADEQRAATQRQLQKAFDSLHLKMPDIDASDARAQYRALAEAQDLTTESGRKTWAAMMGLSEAFASVTDGAAGAATGVASFASQMSNAFGMTGDTISQILHDSVKEAQSAQEARRLAAE
ncbi:MAG: phage tail length tape measure family protein, partial [Proteobacteria bacterium]|nr:phage tail length tape measure family protein [Pseudomonadota bacterium]